MLGALQDLIEKQPSARLWCCLGDILKDPSHYEKAPEAFEPLSYPMSRAWTPLLGPNIVASNWPVMAPMVPNNSIH